MSATLFATGRQNTYARPALLAPVVERRADDHIGVTVAVTSPALATE
jgi:hypothetical protein